jgi:hypothetical protein
MASMPHHMAGNINDFPATSVKKAVTGLMTILELGATAVEETVLCAIYVRPDLLSTRECTAKDKRAPSYILTKQSSCRMTFPLLVIACVKQMIQVLISLIRDRP